MANYHKTIEGYANKYPDSQLVRDLLDTDRTKWDWDIPDEWWGRLDDYASAETVAARAAAFMLAIDTKPKDIDGTLETLSRLQPGVNVVEPHHGQHDFVVPEHSGLLQALPRAMPANDYNPHVGIGLLFEDREEWEATPELPLWTRWITDDREIEAFYGDIAASGTGESQLYQGRDNRIGAGLLTLIDTMSRLGITFDDSRITALHEAAKDKLSTYIVPSYTVYDSRYGRRRAPEVLEDLPVLHGLDPELAEERVREYAVLDTNLFDSQLTKALARIRAQEDCWWFPGMKKLRQNVYMASAALELSELRLQASE